jgi:hypothetical protein
MRILHIGNTGGVPGELSKYMRSQGHTSDVMIFYPDYLHHGCDYDYSVKSKWLRACLPIYSAYRCLAMLRHVHKYDILHFHAFGGITFYLDFPLWKLLGKKIVLHYHGSELRRFGREMPFAKLADIRLVSTPDLLQYGEGLSWLPTAIDLDLYPYNPIKIKEECDNFLIVNAAGSLTHGIAKKGTIYIRRAMRHTMIKMRNVSFKELFGVKHSDAIQEYKKADAIIGQTMVGWYGLFEMECMAMGIPVITYINPEYLQGIQRIPVMNCGQNSAYGIEMCVRDMVEIKTLREHYSREGRKYIEAVHSLEFIGEYLTKIYECIKNK